MTIESESKGDTKLASEEEKGSVEKGKTVWGSEVLANMDASAFDMFLGDGNINILHGQNIIQESGGKSSSISHWKK